MNTKNMTTSQLRNSVNRAPLRRGFFLITCGIFAVLLLGLSPAIATAPQRSVQGQGEVLDHPEGGFSPSHISVDAWLDSSGVAHGTVVWTGGIPAGFVPPADPWLINVTNIIFNGNTAYVSGVIVHSVFPADIGTVVPFVFTDNRRTGQPDEIGPFGTGPLPIVAGNIIVR
jgi:hypothetical protein